MKGKRFIIAGGGTGGHIFPAIAIAHALKALRPDVEILFVGARDRMEMEKVPQAGYRIEGLTIAGFNRSSLIKNIGLPIKLIRSWFQVSRIFRTFRPDAVIGVGGYSSFPVLRYAQSQGVPTFLHEANSFAGKANRMLGRKAVRIFTGTPDMERFFPADKIVVSGNPVRRTLVNSRADKAEALRRFGLPGKSTCLLCIGGSLGAKSINEALAAGLDQLTRSGMELIWQTGKPYYETARQLAAGFPQVAVFEFIADMENAYAAADLVVSRSGAMAVAELCLTGKPVVFVPYPHAAEDHQTANAKKLVDEGAAGMIPDRDVAQSLVPALISLSRDPERMRMMAEEIRKWGVANADEVVAQEILKILEA